MIKKAILLAMATALTPATVLAPLSCLALSAGCHMATETEGRNKITVTSVPLPWATFERTVDNQKTTVTVDPLGGQVIGFTRTVGSSDTKLEVDVVEGVKAAIKTVVRFVGLFFPAAPVAAAVAVPAGG